jgi:hypothetical protein
MGRQRFTPEQIIAKLREVDVLVGQLAPLPANASQNP